MIYEWKCNACDVTIEVHRSLDDYEVPPTPEEYDAIGALETILYCSGHEWVRVVSATSTPFEHLRDKGVFDRTHWHRSTDR